MGDQLNKPRGLLVGCLVLLALNWTAGVGSAASSTFLGTEAAPPGIDAPTTLRRQRVDALDPLYVRVLDAGKWWYVQSGGSNTFDWALLDAVVATNAPRRIIVAAWQRPTWQTDDANFVANFADYTTALANRYTNQLWAIEVWNEPMQDGVSALPGCTNWSLVVSKYNAMLAATAPGIRAKGIKVFGPAWYGPAFSNETANVVKSYLDGYTYHDYMSVVIAPDRLGEYAQDADHVYNSGIPTQLPRLQAALGTNLPIIVDEVGLSGLSAIGTVDPADPYANSVPATNAAWRAAKQMVLYKAFGVTAVIPHVFISSGTYQIHGYETNDVIKLKTIYAYQAALRVQDYTVQSFSYRGTNSWVAVFTNSTATLIVDACLSGLTTNLGQPGAVNVLGASYGGVLTEEPRFFTQWPGQVEP